MVAEIFGSYVTAHPMGVKKRGRDVCGKSGALWLFEFDANRYVVTGAPVFSSNFDFFLDRGLIPIVLDLQIPKMHVFPFCK